MITRTTRHRIAAAGMAAALAVGLGACSPSKTGAAATVDGRRITIADLQNAVRDVKAGNPELTQVQGLDRYLLFDLIAAPYLIDAASQAGMGVSTSQAQQVLPKKSDADPAALLALQAQLAFQALRQGNETAALTSVREQLERAHVQVNPRFGTFDPAGVTDPQKNTIVAAQPNWLVGARPASS